MAADENRAAAQRLRSALDPSAGPERGSRIATLRRREGEELRVTLTEWEGQRYVSVRVWRQGRGKWFPTRGLSVRVSELHEAARVLGVTDLLIFDHPDGDLRWADVPLLHAEIVSAKSHSSCSTSCVWRLSTNS